MILQKSLTFDGKDLERQPKIKKVQQVAKVMEFLLLMGGQATIYDADKRKDTLSTFGRKYLSESLKKPLASQMNTPVV